MNNAFALTLAAMAPHEFFEALVYTGGILLLCVILPVQLAAKIRRIRRARTWLTCRICGYRFIRTNPEATCPHCAARNK